MDVKWYPNNMFMCQTVWSGLQYSFLSETNEQLSPFFYCKEFLMDTVWAEMNQKVATTYGFIYDPETFPKVCLTKCRILLRNREDHYFTEGVQQCMKFINQIEKGLNFNLSKTVEVDNSFNPVMFVSGDAKWLSAPPLLSLYSMLLRLGMNYEKGSAWTFMKKIMDRKIKCYGLQDDYYLRKAFDTIKDLVKTKASRLGTDVKANWCKEDMKAYDIHENGGIVSLATGKGKHINPNWYPKDESSVGSVTCSSSGIFYAGN